MKNIEKLVLVSDLVSETVSPTSTFAQRSEGVEDEVGPRFRVETSCGSLSAAPRRSPMNTLEMYWNTSRF